MASRIKAIASSRVSATDTQPGRSGTYAPNDLGPCSRMTTYSILVILTLLQAGLLPNARQRPGRHIDAKFTSYGDGARLRGVSELTVTATRSHQEPAVGLEYGDNLPHLHGSSLFSSPRCVYGSASASRSCEYGGVDMSKLANFPPLPARPEPVMLPPDRRQRTFSARSGKSADSVSGASHVQTANTASGFYASAVDLGALQQTLGNAIVHFDMNQVRHAGTTICSIGCERLSSHVFNAVRK